MRAERTSFKTQFDTKKAAKITTNTIYKMRRRKKKC